jgi:hypothetical protein
LDLASELERALENLLNDHPVEIRENGRRLTGLEGARFEIRPGAKPLLHLWSPERSLVRRVSGFVETAPGRLRLEIERFGAKGTGRLEIALRERPRRQPRIEREGYAERFTALLRQQFPDDTLESLTVSPDLEHSLSGSYARGWMRSRQQAWAVLGAGPSETVATIDAALTFGIVWLEWIRTRAVAPTISGLRLFLPAGTSRVAAHRLTALAGSSIQLFEWRIDEPLARMIDPADTGNLATWLTPRRETERILSQVALSDAAIRALAPAAIDSLVIPGTRQVAWRYLGLEFARWSQGTIRFGLGREREELSSQSWPGLEHLVAELSAHRRPCGNRRHPLFRAAKERWLETAARADIARIDARLDPAEIYCQVPALSGGDRSVIDLLGATAGDGRLAVIELKAEEDPQLVLQAVDYWLRVRWHLRQGDFQRYGYFPGKSLQAADPLLYLVAPGLRFHPVTETLMRYLSPEIPICRIGLNEDWRNGLRVIERAWRPDVRSVSI